MSKIKIEKIVLATNNRHKVKEIKAILKKSGFNIPLLTMDRFPKIKPVIENRPTIEGNAVKKAKEVARQSGHWALADDTGLFIDALDGKPGVYSARFAGPKCNFEDNNRKVLKLMNNIPMRRRGADFRCVAAFSSPKGKTIWVQGRIRGRIIERMEGGKGFGYDPIFFVPRWKKTFAEMSPQNKNKISHRALAFSKIPGVLKKVCKGYNK